MNYETENVLRDTIDQLVDNMLRDVELECQFKNQLKTAMQDMAVDQRYETAEVLARYLHDAVTMHPDCPDHDVPSLDRAMKYVHQRCNLADWEARRNKLDLELAELMDDWMDSYVDDGEDL